MGSDQHEYQKMEPEELWEKLSSGDKKALGELFSRYFDSLYSYGYRIIPDSENVRDAIQEVFYQLWKYRSNLDNPKSVRSYLFISVRRELLSKKKARQRREQVDKKYIDEEFNPLFDYGKWNEILDLEEEEGQELKKAIKELTPRQREVIYLKYFEGLSTVELSQILEIRAQSIYNLAFDAIENLRSYLDN